MKIETIKENLDRYYRSCINEESNYNFFLELREYIEYAYEIKEAAHILQGIEKERIKATNELNKYSNKVIKEIGQAKKKLFHAIEENKISYDSLEEEIKYYKGYENGKVYTNQPKTDTLISFLKEIIRNLYNNGYKDLVKDFIIESNNTPKIIIKFTFSKALDLYSKEEDKFNNQIETELWGALNKLVLIPKVIQEKKELDGLYENETKFRTDSNLYALLYEMQKIKENEERPIHNFRPIFLIKENFISYLSRLHNYLMKELTLISDGKKIKRLPSKIANRYILSVKDREIWVNNYLISKPHAVGTNLEFFSFIRRQPANSEIAKQIMPDYLKNEIDSKRFTKILNELGFKGEILKVFFPKRGKNKVVYRGDKITKKDLEKTGINISLFLKELEVAHLKNSPK